MGYDLHISRRENWSEGGNEISANEWIDYVNQDVELVLDPKNGPHFAEWKAGTLLDSEWLDWNNGCIFTKNPSQALIVKMVAISVELSGNVQGDDGERYIEGGVAVTPKTSFLSKVKNWFGRLVVRNHRSLDFVEIQFSVGDKVRDIWGNTHTIIKIDPTGSHGIGSFETRRADGTTHTYLNFGHGLEFIDNDSKEQT